MSWVTWFADRGKTNENLRNEGKTFMEIALKPRSKEENQCATAN